MTGLLVTPILQTFDGIDAARDSGLLKSPHPAATQARPFIKQVSDKIKPVAAAAVRLVKEPGGRAASNLKELEAKTADLKALLQKNPPANTWLVPNGPKFPVGPRRSRTHRPGPRRWSRDRPGSPCNDRAGGRRRARCPDPARTFPAVPSAILSIPEIRDYPRINAELSQQLDEGHAHIRLVGAEGQRLLLAGVTGAWSALVEIEGESGPELAAGLDAPGLTVVARGPTADGAGARLRAGRLILLGDTGDALAAGQEGGIILAAAAAGHRAGLGQRGGVLLVLGPLGRLAGERQSGGRMFVPADRLGPHAGHGRRGCAAPDRVRYRPGVPVADAAIFRRSSARPRTGSRISLQSACETHRSSRRPPPDGEKGPGGNMHSARTYWGGPLAALLALVAGCREELGPVRFPTTRVCGRVLESGRPVAGGWIEFAPIEGTVGNRRSAPLAADGRFEVSGVAVGRKPSDWSRRRSAGRAEGAVPIPEESDPSQHPSGARPR